MDEPTRDFDTMLHNQFYCYRCKQSCQNQDWNEYLSCCKHCFEHLFPFNQLNNNELDDGIRAEDHMENNYDRLSHLHFDPFLAHENIVQNDDVDPDFQFYTESTNDSRYYCSDEFNEKFGNDGVPSCDKISSIHFNARSLLNSFDDITSCLNSLNFVFDIIAVSETWLRFNSPLIHMPNYSFVCNNRKYSRGGGVGMYVHESFTFSERKDLILSETSCDSLFIELEQCSGKNIIVGTLYRAPSLDMNSFIDELESLLTRLSRENKRVFLMGDLNIDILRHDSSPQVKNFVNCLFTNFFLPLIHRPTRITPSTATLLDNVLTNQFDLDTKSGLLYFDVSDHLPIFHITYMNVSKNKPADPMMPRRAFTTETIAKFKNEIENSNWEEVLDMHDVNEAYEEFITKFRRIYDINFPLNIPPKKKRKLKSWMTDDLLQSIRYKNNLYKKIIHKPTIRNKNKYKESLKQVNCLKRQAKKYYYEFKFEEYKNNVNRMWQVIKSILNKKRKSTSNSLVCDGKVSTDSLQIANTFNDFFVEIGPKLANLAPQSNTDFRTYLSDPNPKSLFLSPVSQREIYNIVMRFGNNKAPGLDECSPKIVKIVIESISEPLCHICNLSLTTGIFPEKMKIARISPIFKNDDKEQVSNYRPISILSVFSKILEKVIYKRTYNFLESGNCFFESQYGFRSDHSTQMALLELTNKIVESFEHDSYAIGIFIDLSKAFDTIDHTILLSKLTNYGIRGIAHDLFSSYLSNRKQCTVYNCVESEYRTITCGVPQGSLLGPLLFILFINDIYRSSNFLSFIIYADDTNIIYSNKNLDQLCETANTEFTNVCNWFYANKLTINYKKCNYMILRNSARYIDFNYVEVKLNNHVIPRVETTRFLGVIVDSRLTWKYHINEIENKIAKNIGIIYRLSFYLPKTVLRILYCSLILPYFSYCNVVWANTYQSHLKKLCSLQNKIIRIISTTNNRPSTDKNSLFHSLKLLKLNDINKLQQCNLLYRCLNSQLPPKFCNLFTPVSSVHNFNTRSANHIYIPKHRKMIFQHNIRYTGPKIWNDLPEQIKKSLSTTSFKYRMKKMLISAYT